MCACSWYEVYVVSRIFVGVITRESTARGERGRWQRGKYEAVGGGGGKTRLGSRAVRAVLRDLDAMTAYGAPPSAFLRLARRSFGKRKERVGQPHPFYELYNVKRVLIKEASIMLLLRRKYIFLCDPPPPTCSNLPSSFCLFSYYVRCPSKAG